MATAAQCAVDWGLTTMESLAERFGAAKEYKEVSAAAAAAAAAVVPSAAVAHNSLSNLGFTGVGYLAYRRWRQHQLGLQYGLFSAALFFTGLASGWFYTTLSSTAKIASETCDSLSMTALLWMTVDAGPSRTSGFVAHSVVVVFLTWVGPYWFVEVHMVACVVALAVRLRNTIPLRVCDSESNVLHCLQCIHRAAAISALSLLMWLLCCVPGEAFDFLYLHTYAWRFLMAIAFHEAGVVVALMEFGKNNPLGSARIAPGLLTLSRFKLIRSKPGW